MVTGLFLIVQSVVIGQILGPSNPVAGIEFTYLRTSVNCVGPVLLMPSDAGTINSSGNAIQIVFNCTPQIVTIQMGSCTKQVSVQSPDLEIVSIDGANAPCKNEASTYSFSGPTEAMLYEWTITGQPPIGTTEPSLEVVWNTVGVKQISVRAIGAFGCQSAPFTRTVTVQELPANAGIISGSPTICGGNTATYSIAPVAGATEYNWLVAIPGASIVESPPYGTSITVAFDAYASSGTLSAVAKNSCGVGQAAIRSIGVSSVPSPSQEIWGPRAVCASSSVNVTYFIAGVNGALDYIWGVSGGTIVGQQDNEIEVKWPSAGVGTVSVYTENPQCGTGGVQEIDVVVRDGSAPVVTGVIFDHDELQAKPTKELIFNSCQDGTGCVNRQIERSLLNVLLNTGEDYEYGENAFATRVKFRIQGYDFAGATILDIKESLEIEAGAPEQLYQLDITAEHPELSRMRVRILGYNDDPVVADDVDFSVSYTEEFRYDVHAVTPLLSNLSFAPAAAPSNQYTFAWEACAAFENYEFQLLRLYNVDPTDLAAPTSVTAEVDWDKALTIETQTSTTSLTLSIVEGTGYYVWRVRPIGDYYDGGIANDRNWGAWTATPDFDQDDMPSLAFGNGSPPGPYTFYYTQFDEGINFSYQRFFTEGGKIKEGITYANSLLQVEQNQVHIETDDAILVSQTAMDYVGRPAWSSLPTPVEEKVSLGYEALFVKNGQGDRYDAASFDEVGNYRNPEPVRADPGDPFAYYSDNNPDQRIPTAEGYPYSRTRFYSNGVNQLAEVGGPGETHRLQTDGPARTQRTLYSGVSDAELIRVFGDEAPAAESVHKIISIDANNVASVNYRSKAGQTIASCLAVNGVNPLLDGLPSEAEAGFTVVDTLTGDLPYGTYGSQTATTLAITEPTTIELHYEITAATVEDLCLNYCSTCDYSIQFLVQEVDSANGAPLDFTYELPPNFCTAEVNWDTVFVVTLPEVGMYTISRRIRSATNGPMATPSQSYLESHLDSLNTGYDQLLEDSLAWVYELLDAGDLITLYDRLGVDIVNVVNPDSVFSDSLVYVSVGCDSFPLPIMTCPQNECPPSATAFADYFIEIWGSSQPGWVLPDQDERLPFLNNDYSRASFGELIENMIDDQYDCEALWNCWKNKVQTYDELLSLADQVPGYEFDLVSSFLDCTGRQIIGYYPPNEAEDYLTWAHQYFVYDGNYDDCEQLVCGTIDCEPTSPEDWNTFYLCVTNHVDGPPPAIADLTADNESACEDICESRRTGFRLALVQMYHNDSLYVEGDESVLVRDESWGQTFIVWTDSLREAGAGFDVSSFELSCMVNSLVNKCKEGCELTVFTNPLTGDVDSVGSQAEIQAMIASMTYGFEVALPGEAGACADSLEMITSDVYGFGSDSPHEMEIVWDKVYGGTTDDRLLDAKATPDGGYILAGYSQSNPSGNKVDERFQASSYVTDYWVVKIKANGDIEWDQNVKASKGDILRSVVNTKDGGYLLGGVSTSGVNPLGLVEKETANIGGEDYWVVKLNNIGDIDWEKNLGFIEDDQLFDVIETSDGGFLLTGYTVFADTLAYGSEDGLVYKLYPDGEVQWARALGTVSNDYLFASVETAEGDFVLVGTSNGDGTPESGKSEGALGDYDGWLVKIDADGNTVYDLTIGGDSTDILMDIVEKANGDYVLIGTSISSGGTGNKSANLIGGLDHWVVSVSKQGDIQWDKTYGGSYVTGMVPEFELFDALFQVEELINGNLWFGGVQPSLPDDLNINTATYESSGQGLLDYWTVETDAQGNYISDKTWGGLRNDLLNALIVQGPDTLLLAGHSKSPVSGTKTVSNFTEKEYNYWIIQLAQDSCTHPPLCFRWLPLPEIPDSLVTKIEIPTCEEMMADALRTTLEHYIYEFKKAKLDSFEASYVEQCAAPENLDDTFWLEYPLGYHHYTLYYYDRAGNLHRTVPPEGVKLLDVSDPAVLARDVPTDHGFITDYEYNSLQQLVRQNTPDGNETDFYYNDIGQLRFSQNANQEYEGAYSYTKYDPLGRVMEVGQSSEDVTGLTTHLEERNFPSQGLSQRTLTYYTEANGVTYLDASTQPQRFLQNRVSYSRYDGDGNLNTEEDQVTTSYSYDVGGNVAWMAQDIPELGRKFVGYTYDLVSGNVLSVQYQEGAPDQFFHRYGYDADNRLVLAETSVDQKLWERDAHYDYYRHGPLARTEIGEDKLQGVDYVYTIHGWLKGINHSSLDRNKDPGGDNLNNRFAPDAFGMELNYYRGDFTRDGSAFNNTTATDALAPALDHDLFNGNISTWTSQTMANPQGEDLQYEQLTGHQYRYDVLNRIKRADFKYFDGGWNATTDYNTDYTYDANGNILTLNRNAYASKHLAMDSMRYTYTPLTNQLTHVDDPVASANYTEDIDDQDVGNYTYDAIGQLTQDAQEEIASIEWTAYGKMRALTRVQGSVKPALRFHYDAGGNRTRKEVIYPDRPNEPVNTYYVRDASGNMMAIYEGKREAVTGGIVNQVRLTEQPIYGSERLGMRVDSALVRETLFPAGGGAPIELLTNIERVTEDRALQLTYEQVGELTIGNNVSTLRLGGIVALDVSGAGAIAGSLEPVLTKIDQGISVVRAEDREGNLLFTALTTTTYDGQENVCFVRDASNEVMPNSEDIISSGAGSGLSMQVPGSASQYYLFTVGPDDRLYVHTIDLSVVGNGTLTAPLGAVLTKNQLLDAGAYGRMMALIEDNTGLANSQLYTRRYNTDGTATVVRFEVTGTGIGPPVEMVTYRSTYRSDYELQVSPDGKRLAVTNTNKLNSATSPWPIGEVLIYDLSADHKTMTLKKKWGRGLRRIPQSIDFTSSSNYLYLSEDKFNGNLIVGTLRYDILNNNIYLVSDSIGTVRRGYNGNMYVVTESARTVLEIMNPEGQVSLNEVMATSPEVGLTNTGVALQEHRIFLREEEESLFATRHLGRRLYELNDHLGNNRVVFGDVKQSELSAALTPEVGSFAVDMKSKSEYYAFGMGAVDRGFDGGYRFGFQRQEEDDELKGKGNSVNYKYRMHDVRLGRFLSVEPLASAYPWNSAYAFSENSVVDGFESLGLQKITVHRDGFLVKKMNSIYDGVKLSFASNMLLMSDPEVVKFVKDVELAANLLRFKYGAFIITSDADAVLTTFAMGTAKVLEKLGAGAFSALPGIIIGTNYTAKRGVSEITWRWEHERLMREIFGEVIKPEVSADKVLNREKRRVAKVFMGHDERVPEKLHMKQPHLFSTQTPRGDVLPQSKYFLSNTRPSLIQKIGFFFFKMRKDITKSIKNRKGRGRPYRKKKSRRKN